jgi:hypothetical protein
MKRKYEVTYYEYGLTKKKRKRFFSFLMACLFKMRLDRKFDRSAYAVIREL